PEGYVFSGTAQDSALPLESTRDGRGYSASFAMLGGAKVEGVAFGLLTQGQIAGRVWQDDDYDGVLSESENGLRGAAITLLDGDGAEIAQTQTARSGEFTFDQLMPGTYSVRITLPEGYVYTAGGAGSMAERTDEATVTLDLGELHMGETLGGITVGALKPASLGGVVWFDSDDDGRRRSATSRRRDGSAERTDTRRVKPRCDDRRDGQLPLTADARPGGDFLEWRRCSRRTQAVSAAQRRPCRQRRGQTGMIEVLSGENNLDLDVGVVAVGTIAGTVWQDSQYDGIYNRKESGLSGATIELVNPADGQTVHMTQTDENGRYALDFVRMGEYALRVTLPDGMMFTCGGESVVAQTDASCAESDSFAVAMGENREMNIGAISAASLAGRVTTANAVVTLTQGGTVVATAQTDADGYFELTSLRPGAYRVRIALPEHTLFALGTALELPSEDAQEGQTSEINLSMGEHVVLDEITAVKTATVSGRAWQDTNADGAPSDGEPALSGVTVTLLDENSGVVAADRRRRRPVQLQPHPKRRICVALHPARRRTVCRPERRCGRLLCRAC
ncbi:MAG: SdrD B-like domain-containing protein, partial [Christensenellales bacterium]